MKNLVPALLILLLSCQTSEPTQPTADCVPLDIGVIAQEAQTLFTEGKNVEAARIYFKAGLENRSSELFAYAGWQFEEAGKTDSALIAINKSIEYGMNNPYVLDKFGLDPNNASEELAQEVTRKLEELNAENGSISNFEMVVDPVNEFWPYFEKALADTPNATEHLSEYICNGSPAVRDYYHIRYESVNNMERVMIRENPAVYTHVMKYFTPEALDSINQDVLDMMQGLEQRYPKAVFPKVYLIPGLINSSGTLSELGLFIGVEMFSQSPDLPTEGLNDWQVSHISGQDDMKYDLVHELMHFQQSYGDSEHANLLLGKLIQEGVCDFLVSVLADGGLSTNAQKRLTFLEDPENKALIMEELKRDLYTADLSSWMYNGGAIHDRPSDMGYTMGYLICKSYYENQEDKDQAFYELLNTDDFRKIYVGSEYGELIRSKE